jgi:hypothetical protein
MKTETTFVYARLNARVMPLDRGELYEDPLIAALEENGLGAVTGGGTGQSEDGEIDYCGIDIDLHDVENGVPFLCEFLTELGAPRGSALEFERDGERVELPFGSREGLAIYLNGTDLPDEVYEKCDVNDLFDEINRLLGERGAIRGHWQGPTETALYLYGHSADEMKNLIASHIASYPLCQKARLVQIA